MKTKESCIMFYVIATDTHTPTRTHTQRGRMMAIKTETRQSTINVGVGFFNLCGKMSVLQKKSVLESELICYVGIGINLLLSSDTYI